MNFECYDLAGQRVIRVQRDLSAGDFGDRHKHPPAVRTCGPQGLAYLRDRTSVYPFPVDRYEHAIAALAEGVLRRNRYRPRFSHVHADHGLVYPQDDPLATDPELAGMAPCGCKADRAVVELAGIVDLHRVADSRLPAGSPHSLVDLRFHNVLTAGLLRKGTTRRRAQNRRLVTSPGVLPGEMTVVWSDDRKPLEVSFVLSRLQVAIISRLFTYSHYIGIQPKNR